MISVRGISIRQRTVLTFAVIITISLIGGFWYFSQPKINQNLIVSTTSSLYETGFLDVLKTSFETKYSQYNVSFISVGTALAIETAKKGNADLIFVHDPVQEKAFLTDGFGLNRKIMAYNFYIIVGPDTDPSGIKNSNPVDALKKIASEGLKGNAIWVSRGDGSGTHSKEKALWKLASLNLDELKIQIAPDGKPWYYEAGTTMTPTLQLANQKRGYTISDVATFLKNSVSGNIQLLKIVEAGKDMINVYSMIACNPDKNPNTKYQGAMELIKYLASDEGQLLLQNYGFKEFNRALFTPWITTLKTNTNTELIQWVKDYAYIEGSDCPEKHRRDAGNLYG